MRLTTVVVIGALCTLCASAHGGVLGTVEDFNGGGAAGFGGGSQSYVHSSTGGVGGVGDGYLTIANTSSGKLGVFTSRAEFTGDLLADGASGFSFWLNDVGNDDPLDIHVSVGANHQNVWQSLNGFLPPENDWEKFSVDVIDESDWVQIIGSGTFADAILNSDRLLFRHDVAPFVRRPAEIDADFAVDRIAVVPEPSAALTLLLGCMLAGCRRRFGRERGSLGG